MSMTVLGLPADRLLLETSTATHVTFGTHARSGRS